ncbi:MAG: hypothetical protein WBA12_09635 [Catalinimonas sp.]
MSLSPPPPPPPDARRCEECGAELFGRSDQRFCSDPCRTAHHNRLFSDVNSFVRRVNRVLLKNRRILAKLNPEGKAVKCQEETLRRRGFDFNYFTSTYTTRKQDTYYFCYDQGYLRQESGFCLLVVNREYRHTRDED